MRGWYLWVDNVRSVYQKDCMVGFPENFLWGASLSAHQVEGDDFHSDWWRWEQGSRRIRDRSTSQMASGHFERYAADFALARKLGHSAHLFSLSWARVQPAEGAFDEAALQHYSAVVDALHKNKLEPICVLCHVAAPQWFAERYGWHNAKAPHLFETYAERIAQLLAGRCRWYIPILEPMHQVHMQYMAGAWPPQSKSIPKALRALHHVLEAHERAYRALHRARADAMVGLSVRTARFQPLEETSSWDLRAARREKRRCNRLVLDAVLRGEWPLPFGKPEHARDAADFVGVSYYGSCTVRFDPLHPSRLFAASTQDEVDPVGFREVLRDVAQYGRPILITGNGIAADNDHIRARFLLDHLAAVLAAIRDGSDVLGYSHHSLLDGFEWHEGYGPRFGLVHVARDTLARTPNPSAYLYKDICETGTFRRGTVDKHCPDWIPPFDLEES